MSTLELILGNEPRQRMRLKRSLMAAGVYGLSLLAQWRMVMLGQADAAAAGWLALLVAVVVGAFYVALRSGIAIGLRDPALTMPQILFAILALALAYLINPPVRGMLLMVVALVLMFGAFTLSPRHCRNLGWMAVAVFGFTMALGVRLDPQRFPLQIEAMHFAFAAMVLPTLSVLAGQLSQLRLDQQCQKRELRDALSRLKEIASHDDLTGLPNRRHMQEWMPYELSRGDRTGKPLCVAMLDLDHFKRINDTHGHAAGDEVLRIFARQASIMLRGADVLARWGGEEFLLVMPETSLAEARIALERLARHLAEPASWGACANHAVSFSAGLVQREPAQPLDMLLQRADAALYEAKRRGRDRVVVA